MLLAHCPDPIQYHQLHLRPQLLVPDDGGDFLSRHRPQQRLGYRSREQFGSDLLLRLPEFSDRRASYSPDFSTFENLYCEPCIQVGRRKTYTYTD